MNRPSSKASMAKSCSAAAVTCSGITRSDRQKHSVLGILYDAVDYRVATDEIIRAAQDRRPCSVSALAVHGVMTGLLDAEQRYRLNCFDLVVPDGQPVRWALNWLYRTELEDRVYGPKLTIEVLRQAAEQGLPVYLYGSTKEVITKLLNALGEQIPTLCIAGAEPSRFRSLTPEEYAGLVRRIQDSGARLVLAGLGCPRQEIFGFEMRSLLSMPILAIGAAFPFIAGTVRQAPVWMQDRGLEWLYRMVQEPGRLWKRYVLLNPAYVACLLLQRCRYKFDSQGSQPRRDVLVG